MSWAEVITRLLADPHPARIEVEGLSIGGRCVDAHFYNLAGVRALVAMRGFA